MGNATGIYNLMRSVGGSVGIATVMAMLVRGAQSHQNTLAGDAGLGSPVASMMARGLQARLFAQGTDMVSAQAKALGALYRSMQQQSALMAYADNFRLIAILAFACIPLLLLFQRVKKHD
jgi:DHA2 family multidrug resistance protein